MSKGLIVAAGILAAGIAAASAADMRMPVKAPPVVEPPFSWAGFYIGGNVGYSWGRATTDQTDTTTATTTTELFRGIPATGPSQTTLPGVPGTFPQVATTAVTGLTSGRSNVDGFVGGGQIGYNWQINRNWLLGLETDFQGSAERGSVTVCSVAGCPAGSLIGTANNRLKWFGTLRGRVAWIPTERLLLYATGGLAYGQLDSDYVTGVVGTPVLALSSSTTRAGWTVGAGAEGALDRHWSIKGEYLFMDLGRFGGGAGTGAATTTVVDTPLLQAQATIRTTTVAATTGSVSTRFFDHILRVGVNYRF